MAVITKWSNVQVAVQSALGAAKTITAVTKASPGVVSSTAHGFVSGEYVLHTVQGMSQINNRVFRVDNEASGTYELEGEDTTLYDTFVSGTANLITFGTTMSTVTGLQSSGGDFDFVDTTTIHDTVRTQIPGLPSPATYTLENFWDVSDAALIALKQASDTQTTRAIRFTFANGQKVMFAGYVGATLLPGGNAQELVTTPVVITMYGRPTVYAT
jgi:hypothetical protein